MVKSTRKRRFPSDLNHCPFPCPLDSECRSAPLGYDDRSVMKAWIRVEGSLKPRPQSVLWSQLFYSFESSDLLGLSCGEGSLQRRMMFWGCFRLQSHWSPKDRRTRVCPDGCENSGSAHCAYRTLQVAKIKTYCSIKIFHFWALRPLTDKKGFPFSSLWQEK